MVPAWKRSDVVVGLVLVAFGGVATWLALGISAGPAMRTLPPNTFPLICTIGIGLCGAALLIRGLVAGETAARLPLDARQAVVLALILGYFLAFEHVDYRLAVLVFVAVTMFVLGCRSWKQLVIAPVATMAAIWIFFQQLFDVYLPTWI